jgi:3-deoxy-D-manno-octulosonic-acid transferase
VIVPRHPQRFDEVAAIFQKHNMQFQRKSLLKDAALQTNTHASSKSAVILGDTMGELFTYYAACDFTLVGGSLLPYGGQNLIEAAVMGKPILIGEHTFNFAEASNNAVATGAAIRAKDYLELREKIQYLLENKVKRQEMSEAALRFNEASTGATTRMMQLIMQYLH